MSSDETGPPPQSPAPILAGSGDLPGLQGLWPGPELCSAIEDATRFPIEESARGKTPLQLALAVRAFVPRTLSLPRPSGVASDLCAPLYLPLLPVEVETVVEGHDIVDHVEVPAKLFLPRLCRQQGVEASVANVLAACEASADVHYRTELWQSLGTTGRDFMRSIFLAAAVDIAGTSVEDVAVHEYGGIPGEADDGPWKVARGNAVRIVTKGRERAAMLQCWPWCISSEGDPWAADASFIAAIEDAFHAWVSSRDYLWYEPDADDRISG